MNIQNVSVVPEGLLINEKKYPLYSGSFHYWRHEQSKWNSILTSIKEMGFNTICTYMPWNVHEVDGGSFDFGQKDPRKDVGAFLTECKKNGLFVLARPGPHINSELPWFGFPRRIVEDESIQARTVSGAPAVLAIPFTPFVMPSYASEKFYAEVSKYFGALSKIIAPFIFPKGPIVAIQSDNEMSFFFRMRCYDVDYHPESIALYQKKLQEKYGSIEALNRRYSCKTPFYEFSKIDPPREYNAGEYKDLPYFLDWAEFQEYYVTFGITKIRTMLEKEGLKGIPYFHNYPVSSPSVPFNISELEKTIDIAGVDDYPKPNQYKEQKRGAIYASTMSRLPFIPEFLSGVWPSNRPLPVEEEAFITLTAFLFGIRAINYYMLVERDRWVGCPIKRDGSHRPEFYSFYSRWNSFLNQTKWEKLRPERDVLILTPRIYDRLHYLSSFTNFPYEFVFSLYLKLPKNLFLRESTLGGRDDISRYKEAWINAFSESLDHKGVSYGFGDCGISDEKLSQYKAVIVPLFDFGDEKLMRKLRKYAQAGGHIICGPRWPSEDPSGKIDHNWFDTPSSISNQNCSILLELDSNDKKASTLPVFNIDIWDREDCDTIDQEKLVNTRIKPGQDLPFLHSSKVGKGSVSLVAGVFPSEDELDHGVDDYRIWASWLAEIIASKGISSSWICDNKNIDISILSSEDVQIIGVINPTSKVQRDLINLPKRQSYEEIRIISNMFTSDIEGEPNGSNTVEIFSAGDNLDGINLNVKLEPYSISIIEMM